jgi:glycine/D-amino acid oxidase-like deaminating enzyme
MVKVQVAVVGAGVTGLMLSQKLSQHGFKVLLIERGDQLSGGPSTRNEGWLHRGTYHAVSIQDPEKARCVAQRCIHGYNQIKHYAPAACDEIHQPVFAFTFRDRQISDIKERWASAGVKYEQVEFTELKRNIPELVLEDAAGVFRVRDISINTRVLYRKLLNECERLGVIVRYGTTISFKDSEHAVLRRGDRVEELNADIFCYASGYTTRELFRKEFGVEIPMRFFKSHLLNLPRLASCGLFCLDPHEAAVMNHGQVSIVGLNEDAQLCEDPSFEPDPDRVANIEEAARKLFHIPSNIAKKSTACVKVDVSHNADARRSLDVVSFQPLIDNERHLCILPGKMTEAPFITDQITRVICDQIDDSRIALRPCDAWDQGTQM